MGWARGTVRHWGGGRAGSAVTEALPHSGPGQGVAPGSPWARHSHAFIYGWPQCPSSSVSLAMVLVIPGQPRS